MLFYAILKLLFGTGGKNMAITVNQIAQKCGVSRTTVLRALNGGGSVKKETKEKILQVAEENNYRPNLLARSLNHGRTMSLGVVTINIENMYFVQSLNTINKEADKRGYFTNIVVCDESLEWERKLIRGLAERQMEGIMINPLNQGSEFEEFLLSLHIPIVCIGNQVSEKITTVQVNEMAAAMDAVELIASKRYEQIVFVCPPLEVQGQQNIYVHEQRLKGFKAAMGIHCGLHSEVVGKKEFLPDIERILSGNPERRTAFLCSGDSYALTIKQWGEKKNMKIPEDFGLMGFDDISVLQYISPKLTTVSTNLEGVAATAVVELIQQIDSEEYSPKSIILNYKILDRDTL
jgi:LacI family transcriptional regulator